MVSHSWKYRQTRATGFMETFGKCNYCGWEDLTCPDCLPNFRACGGDKCIEWFMILYLYIYVLQIYAGNDTLILPSI